MVGITVQVQSGLGLPYGFGAEAGLPLPLRAAWNALVGPLAGFIPTLSPLFDEVPVQKIKDLMAHAEAVSGQSAPDLLRWYAVDPGPIDPQFVAAAISALPFVTQAAVQGPAEVTLTPHLNPQFPAQRYLLDAPEGIDAKHAWSLLGGQGVGVLIIDVEHGWWPDHEDLADVRVEVLGGIPDRLDRHGTSVFGILAATDNTKGIIGIAPAANLALSPLRRAPGPGIVNPEKNLLNAIFRAMMRQTREPDRPMVLLIEVGGEIESGKKNALPPSIELCVPDLIQMAVQEGITVIEAAANAIESTQQELAESHHRFDDTEYRFRGLLALFAVRCPQTSSHGLDRCRVFRRRQRRGKSLAPGGVMRLPPGRCITSIHQSCQSRPLRASREASRQRTAPTCPAHRAATNRSKPGRSTAPLADRPRSSSMISTLVKPRRLATSTNSYWRR